MTRNKKVASDTTIADVKIGTKPSSKRSIILALLERPEGAIINDMMTATGWLPHTARAALSGLRKQGYLIVANKGACGMRYHLKTPETKTADGAAKSPSMVANEPEPNLVGLSGKHLRALGRFVSQFRSDPAGPNDHIPMTKDRVAGSVVVHIPEERG